MRGDLVIVVDVLRFSTTVVTAAERGVIVIPAKDGREIEIAQARHGVILIDLMKQRRADPMLRTPGQLADPEDPTKRNSSNA